METLVEWQNAESAIKDGNTEEGLRILKQLADKGVWQASTYLGRLLEERGSAENRADYIEAGHWFSRALSQSDNPETRLDIARYFYFGLGDYANPRSAYEHATHAAPEQSAEASIMLGELCLAGKGTDVDESRAAHFFEMAVARDYPAGYLGLSRLKLRQRQYFSAFRCFIKALCAAIPIVRKDANDPRLIGTGGRRGNYRIGKTRRR